MGLSAFNLMRARMKAEEEERKAKEEALLSSQEAKDEEVLPNVVEEAPPVQKPKRKRTDAEKLKSKKKPEV